jgi:hypothetical protein
MAKHHPPFPLRPLAGQYIKFIIPYRLLAADAAMSRMVSLTNSAAKRSKTGTSGTEDALWVAMSALQDRIMQEAASALRAGELLLCWHGTKATAIGQVHAA